MKKDFPKLERFVICLNKVDIFALQKGQTSMETPTERQIDLIKQKCSNVSEEFRSFMPEASVEVLFYSALHEPPAKGWDRISFLRLQSADAYEELKTKMKSVIDLTVEKLHIHHLLS